ncbi:hypothetical protein JQC92_15475 [Shewanella sp. 202IG2-18]|uniref:hypothetical protein n=1 Tax=Parashewanella hymeniacidonis TaxID=2807618 RepID=UPI0019601593|nr:hypothetical protein [Parashewanella hymeniacidonis]MBM7073415.1 hypothetical protein [Parashewanella hymeniacidonis]
MNSLKTKNKKALIALIAVFVLPVISAKVVLSLNLYDGGQTNKGELLPETLAYQTLEMKNPHPKKWQIVFLLPEHCGKPCQQQLYLLKQTHTALGREQGRVEPVVLLTENSDQTALVAYQFTTAPISTQLQKQLDKQQIIIADPLGKLVTRYNLKDDEKQRLLQGKAMMNDLRKMLKLSRVG